MVAPQVLRFGLQLLHGCENESQLREAAQRAAGRGDIPEAFGWFAATGKGCNPCSMSAALTAQDLWPLLLKLPHEEQVRLAKLALHAASRGGVQDRRTYQSVPPAADEFAVEEDPLAWEAEGWDEF